LRSHDSDSGDRGDRGLSDSRLSLVSRAPEKVQPICSIRETFFLQPPQEDRQRAPDWERPQNRLGTRALPRPCWGHGGLIPLGRTHHDKAPLTLRVPIYTPARAIRCTVPVPRKFPRVQSLSTLAEAKTRRREGRGGVWLGSLQRIAEGCQVKASNLGRGTAFRRSKNFRYQHRGLRPTAPRASGQGRACKTPRRKFSLYATLSRERPGWVPEASTNQGNDKGGKYLPHMASRLCGNHRSRAVIKLVVFA
jgi:hypothetical protein